MSLPQTGSASDFYQMLGLILLMMGGLFFSAISLSKKIMR
ncbi:MAG TPA: LPXTG cell wall anchor domain-containing protein [Psychromonas hadalis]|nr:LPXTG cell wall anchor domain-containing protein [Psychromonas hadalis]